MKYKGIIFDLDGTLLNSIEDLAESMNTVLEKHSFPTHGVAKYEQLIGNGILNLVKKALPKSHNDDQKCKQYFDMMFDVYRENCTNKTRPYERITELLDSLTSNNIKIAVLSNKADELTKKAVATLLPDWRFESVNGLTDENSKKPHPGKALEISNKMGLKPKDILFVGDSGVDMNTAVNAGMDAVGVLWGFRSRDELERNGATHIIEQPLELLKILKI